MSLRTPEIESLLVALKAQRLGHCYLITPPHAYAPQAGQQLLQTEIGHFLQATLAHFGAPILSTQQLQENAHPDLIFIRPKNPERPYQLEDLEELFNRAHFKNFSLPWQLVLIERAELLTDLIINKLLKELEAPKPQTTYLLLTSRPQRFLATLQSRAITLTLTPPPQTVGPSATSALKKELQEAFASGQGLEQILDPLLKRSPNAEELLYELLLEESTERHHGMAHKVRILELSQHIERTRLFYGAARPRLILLLSELRTLL